MIYLDACRPEILEVHLFQFRGDLYGQLLSVTLTYFVRASLDFENSEIAKIQIKKDAVFCLNYLQSQVPYSH
jgi:riboflavin kinase/FMN adenylyltransferase